MTSTTAVVAALATGLLAVVLVMAATAVRTKQLDKAAVVDVAWGSGFVAIAAATGVLGQVVAADTGADGAGGAGRRWLLVALVAVWGGRLAWHVRGRALGEHGGADDPRYLEMLGGPPSQVGIGTIVRRVLLVQGAAMWFVSLPVMLGAVLPLEWAPLVVLGLLVWGVGFAFETIGDAQLKAYKARPKAERPPVMDRGLWAWTRHPNYFGDACGWWGLWIAGGLASGWVVGLATVLAPVAMTFFIRNATGAKLLEREMMKRPGYPEYAERTPMFVPRPPGRR